MNYKAEMTVIDVTNPTVMTKFAFAMANLVRVNFSILGSEGPVTSFSINGTQSKMFSSRGKPVENS